MKRWILACAALGLLAGCAAAPGAMPPSDSAARLELPQVAPRKGQSGGVFVAGVPWSLTSDSRAFRPGDLLTVILMETTQASKTANTAYGKSSGLSLAPPTLFGKVYPKAEFGVDSSSDFSGQASSSQQNTLQGAITVVVQEVLSNGLLRVSGEKNLYLNQGEEFIRLSGYVRAADIDSDNRVSSQRVANANIAYSGRGVGNDVNNPGWLMRLFASPWSPF